jgi:adenosylhomocysteine nucleosidase
MERNKIGFVTGLAAEARFLRDSGFLVGVGGGQPEGAYRAAETLVAQGATALVSFGLAGGLAPDAVPGTVLVPNAVLEGPRVYPCDAGLITFLGGATGRPIMAGHRIAATVADKAALFRRTKSVAIDLESGAVARVASARRLPFAVLRAVADPAGRTLAPAALIPLKPGGGINLPAILLSLLRHPTQLPNLIALARDAARARAALLAHLKQLKPV